MLTLHSRARSSGRISATLAVAATLAAMLFATAYTLAPGTAAPPIGAGAAAIELIAPAKAAAMSAAQAGYFPAQFTVQSNDLEPQRPQF